MHTGLIILVWIVNFGISIWNAYAVGKAWVETKHAGGWSRIIAWSGAIMSASGFSWCYLIVLAAAAYGLEWISQEHLILALQLGYILIIPGVLASGLMITLDSWARAYRTRQISDIGVAAWNTYAQIHNTFNAIKDFDKAFAAVVDAFGSGGGGSSSDDKKKGGMALVVVFIIVVIALLSGILTTAVIIARVAGNDELPDTSYGPPKK